ncbi:MAG: nucleotide exchange factor GrpE [Ruminococcaceae bacterium]|nr:nucleotide exchange factor GrpE [Oscillospiraceae bacterium]
MVKTEEKMTEQMNETVEEVLENTEAEQEKNTESAKKEKKCSKKELDEMKKELDSANEKLAEQTDKYLRIVAEYDNFRKRVAKEKEGIYSDAYVDAVKELLPILDNLERAVSFADSGNLGEGVTMTLNMMKDIFAKMGVEEIETDNKEFDPNFHNAVMHVEDEGFGENMVIETFSKGYKKGDKIIRYAMVKVAN